MIDEKQSDEALLDRALDAARDTKCLRIGHGVRREAAEVFASLYGSARAIVIADENTFRVAGRDVQDALRALAQASDEPFVLRGENIYAEYAFVDAVRNCLQATDAVPIAVGSGTISDLTKLAAHQVGRPYMTVATAASMDGYTAFGASITYRGSKQTFDCPAAEAVVADLDVIGAAPEGMNASGYADLAAKIPAGADWLAAEACGVEKIDPAVWETVQARLRDWCSDPEGVRLARPEAIRCLITGLLMTGFAMQASCSSRPASGAEHQFSHLWDMEHHTHAGAAPSHGFKVGIGSLASIALYESLLEMPLDELDPGATASAWPDAAEVEREIASMFTVEELAAKAREESLAKHPTREQLRQQLELVRREWPRLAQRLRSQLVRHGELRDMLAAAGAPYTSEQIGIDRERMEQSYRKAYHIRRRFTVLDLARRAGAMEPALAQIFGKQRGRQGGTR